jgi:hydrogenase maturation protease
MPTPDSDNDILVIGIGNIVEADNGAGVRALQMLRDSSRLPAGISFLETRVLGSELVACLQNSRSILMLDAVNANAEPGSLFRLTREDLMSVEGGRTVGPRGVAELLRDLARVSPTRQNVLLLGVQSQFTGRGTELTLKVRRALPVLVEAALEHLFAWATNPALHNSALRKARAHA